MVIEYGDKNLKSDSFPIWCSKVQKYNLKLKLKCVLVVRRFQKKIRKCCEVKKKMAECDIACLCYAMLQKMNVVFSSLFKFNSTTGSLG